MVVIEHRMLSGLAVSVCTLASIYCRLVSDESYQYSNTGLSYLTGTPSLLTLRKRTVENVVRSMDVDRPPYYRNHTGSGIIQRES
jgi:hypothetical protein